LNAPGSFYSTVDIRILQRLRGSPNKCFSVTFTLTLKICHLQQCGSGATASGYRSVVPCPPINTIPPSLERLLVFSSLRSQSFHLVATPRRPRYHAAGKDSGRHCQTCFYVVANGVLLRTPVCCIFVHLTCNSTLTAISCHGVGSKHGYTTAHHW
jgi:hypothetical protein